MTVTDNNNNLCIFIHSHNRKYLHIFFALCGHYCHLVVKNHTGQEWKKMGVNPADLLFVVRTLISRNHRFCVLETSTEGQKEKLAHSLSRQMIL